MVEGTSPIRSQEDYQATGRTHTQIQFTLDRRHGSRSQQNIPNHAASDTGRYREYHHAQQIQAVTRGPERPGDL